MDLTEMPIIECLECQGDIQSLLFSDSDTKELICEQCLEKQTTCFNRMVLETREMEASVQFVRNNFDAEASNYCEKARINQDRLFQEKRANEHYQKMKAKMEELIQKQLILQREERELIDELMNLQQKEVLNVELYNRQTMKSLKLFESLMKMDEKRKQLSFYEKQEDDIFAIGQLYEILIKGEKVFINQQQINEKTYLQLSKIYNLLEIKYGFSTQTKFQEQLTIQNSNQRHALHFLQRITEKIYHLWQFIRQHNMVRVDKLPFQIKLNPEIAIESHKFTHQQNIEPIILSLAVNIKFLCNLQISALSRWY